MPHVSPEDPPKYSPEDFPRVSASMSQYDASERFAACGWCCHRFLQYGWLQGLAIKHYLVATEVRHASSPHYQSPTGAFHPSNGGRRVIGAHGNCRGYVSHALLFLLLEARGPSSAERRTQGRFIALYTTSSQREHARSIAAIVVTITIGIGIATA